MSKRDPQSTVNEGVDATISSRSHKKSWTKGLVKIEEPDSRFSKAVHSQKAPQPGCPKKQHYTAVFNFN